MFRSKSQIIIGESDKEARFVQERIDNVEKYFAEFCSAFAAFARKSARLRDKTDELAKSIQSYVKVEEVNRSTSTCLANFSNTLSVIGDYNDAEVQRLNAKVILPLSQYQITCRRAKENMKHTFTTRDEEFKRKKHLDKVKDENPKNQQRITQAKTNFMKATVEMSRVVKGLEEQIDSFEKQKLHDIKMILTNFVMIELSFHAKALELFTKGYQDIAEINEMQDLEEYRLARGEFNWEFRDTIRGSSSLSKLETKPGSQQNRLTNDSFSKTTQKILNHQKESSKSEHNNSSVGEFDDSTDDSEEIHEDKSRIREENAARNSTISVRMIPPISKHYHEVITAVISNVNSLKSSKICELNV